MLADLDEIRSRGALAAVTVAVEAACAASCKALAKAGW